MICKKVSLSQKSWWPNGDRAKTLTWTVVLIAHLWQYPPPPPHRDCRGLSKTTKPTEIRQCRSPLIHKLQQSKSIIQTSTLVFQNTPGSLKMKLTFSVNCGKLFHQLPNILATKYYTKMKHQK